MTTWAKQISFQSCGATYYGGWVTLFMHKLSLQRIWLIVMTLFLVLQSFPYLTQSQAFCLTATHHLSGTSVYCWKTCFLFFMIFFQTPGYTDTLHDIVWLLPAGIIQCRFVSDLTLGRKSKTSYTLRSSSHLPHHTVLPLWWFISLTDVIGWPFTRGSLILLPYLMLSPPVLSKVICKNF